MEIRQEGQPREAQQVAPQVHSQTRVGQGNASNRTKVSFPGNRRKRKINKNLIVVAVAVILLSVLGYFILEDGELVLSPEEPTPTLVEERVTPTSTPTPKLINKDEIKIEVLNGTGIGGQAAFLQDKLEGLDYGNIEVGNANTQDNSETEVVFERSVADEVKEEIIEILEELYKEVDVSTSSLDGFDIQIIAGLKKGQSFPTEAPVVTSTPAETTTATVTPSPTTNETPTQTP